MQARRAPDGGHANLGTLSRREILIERLKMLSLTVIEPTGQDGRTCLYLAIAHQLGRAEIPRRAWHASELEKDMVTWLHLHANDAISVHVKSDGTFEQTSLSSFWTDDELHDVLCFTSEGDHHAMVVILTMLYQNHGIQAEVRVYDWRGHAYDRTVHAPAVWGIVPAVTLCLGYTGNHYLSVVLDNYGHGGQRARFFELTARSGTLPGSMRPLPVRAVANQARCVSIPHTVIGALFVLDDFVSDFACDRAGIGHLQAYGSLQHAAEQLGAAFGARRQRMKFAGSTFARLDFTLFALDIDFGSDLAGIGHLLPRIQLCQESPAPWRQVQASAAKRKDTACRQPQRV